VSKDELSQDQPEEKPTGVINYYRTIWLSDFHVGTAGCKANYLLDFSALWAFSTDHFLSTCRKRLKIQSILSATLKRHWLMKPGAEDLME
jgi:hypothetical protein